MERETSLSPSLRTVCRLGLATRGNTHLSPESVQTAFERGIRYWNWCGYEDGMSHAVNELGKRRSEIVLAVQIQARDRDSFLREFEGYLKVLGTDRIEILTIYYLESREEWHRLGKKDGVLETMESLKSQGVIEKTGVTSHQRWLVAEILERGETDLVMVRYNAAHRGVEKEVFPLTNRTGVPVIAYTCLRWGKLLQNPDDTGEFQTPPTAPECYRFVLSNPSVSVALMAPNDARELEENLSILDDWNPLSPEEMRFMRQWGDYVHERAGSFP